MRERMANDEATCTIGTRAFYIVLRQVQLIVMCVYIDLDERRFETMYGLPTHAK